jgi:hypothetical protein
MWSATGAFHANFREITLQCYKYRPTSLYKYLSFETFPTLCFPKPIELLDRYLPSIMCSLHHVTMCIPGIAVAAPELASHVGIDRPKTHTGALRRVDDRFDVEIDQRDCFLSILPSTAPSHTYPIHMSDRKSNLKLGKHLRHIPDIVQMSKEWFAPPLFWSLPGLRRGVAYSAFVRPLYRI